MSSSSDSVSPAKKPMMVYLVITKNHNEDEIWTAFRHLGVAMNAIRAFKVSHKSERTLWNSKSVNGFRYYTYSDKVDARAGIRELEVVK